MQPTTLCVVLVTSVLSHAVRDVVAVGEDFSTEERAHFPRIFTSADAWINLEILFRAYRETRQQGFNLVRTAYELASYSHSLIPVPQIILEQLRLRDEVNRIPDIFPVDDPPPEVCSDTEEVYFLRDRPSKRARTEEEV